MGPVCVTPYEGENYMKQRSTLPNTLKQNGTQGQLPTVKLGQWCEITPMLGHFTQHSCQLLLCLTTLPSLSFCDELREYANDHISALEKIRADGSDRYSIKTRKGCPYQKVLVALLPEYSFTDFDDSGVYQYHKKFRGLVRSVLAEVTQLTIYVTQTGDAFVYPTQTLVALMLKELCTGVQKQTKVYVISPEIRTLQLIRYELVKTEACTGPLNSWDRKILSLGNQEI